ncbi:MAG: hypothetical protein LC754_11555 [Acidobacteria bacterium]|nr:hypothetical protein [Acidobacteriota bacterium]
MTTKRTLAMAVTLAAMVLVAGAGRGAQPVAATAGRCHLQTLDGAYGFAGSGLVVAGPQTFPLAIAARLAFDGQGHLTGKGTVSFNGQVDHETMEGTYTVNEDCTGSISLVGHHTGFDDVHNFDFVIVDGGKEVAFVETDAGTVAAATMKRQ